MNRRPLTLPSLSLLLLLLLSCGRGGASGETTTDSVPPVDSTAAAPEPEEQKPLTAADISLREELLFEEYHLDSVYDYRDTFRVVQYDQVRERLAYIESLYEEAVRWAVVANRKNKNGESPTIKDFHRNEYKHVTDKYGVERYQSAALYEPGDTLQPVRYTQDGSLVHVIDSVGSFYHIFLARHDEGEYMVKRKYLELLPDSVFFDHVIFVDRNNQNILTTERESPGQWLVRSVNPATTGRKRPPYARATPLGIYLLQEKKPKMYYTGDGSSTIAGFAPYASRFCCGAYIHGVPVNNPHGKIREWSPSLGTTPRSHMCVRNASSHAKFVYDWAPLRNSLVVVIE